jgi:hypothetical protein
MAAEFFQEENGTKSSARLVFLGGMIWSVLFTTAGTFILKWTPGELIAVFSAASAVFIGLKLGQKPMESKKNGNGQITP